MIFVTDVIENLTRSMVIMVIPYQHFTIFYNFVFCSVIKNFVLKGERVIKSLMLVPHLLLLTSYLLFYFKAAVFSLFLDFYLF